MEIQFFMTKCHFWCFGPIGETHDKK